MNIPNQLTIARMIITPVFLAVFTIPSIPYNYAIAMLLFIIGSLTDLFDGIIARKRNLVTNFGKFADPLADKILTTSALLGFMALGYCNVWVVFLVLFREFAISSMRLIAAAEGLVIPANIWGKVKTTFQMVATIAIMLGLVLVGDFGIELPLHFVADILFWIIAVLTIVSGVVYVKDGVKVIDFSK
ncbi:MAG: CDP-diacylglycerol--glycerol-3-phosphate 3-phosphatidyltransferase [Ruminococcaceae bacterium]|nr:CDP-diacylglycerol--glycerol-3-phosphate 3-phosphatidyltransferase [Oscillospiraceae bacterium]